jgi:uroporphyrin-III C-methyltransferase/precorrin-2 dehydrogenase/sirohydrochlorin ferrochelatase/uroporphyrin-III C-methyltransferase
MPQAQINQLLVEYGRLSVTADKVIVRLKGGDPTIFGRVSEEAEALEQAGLRFAIVPGITSACAASAYSGIALTARGQATAVQFLTAQFADPSRQPDWQNYRYQYGNNPTLVVYMGLNRLNELCLGLMNVGWPGEMPVALLDQVSTDAQQQLIGNLSDICARYACHQQGPNPLSGPTLIVIGLVVSAPMAVSPTLLKVPENLLQAN